MSAVDLASKVSLLIGDFWAVEKLSESIEHGFEKRIVARSGLLKLDSLLMLARQYKNLIRASRVGAHNVNTVLIDGYLARLAKDRDDAFGKARDALAAHQLALQFREIGDSWLFMNSDNFGVLRLDLEEIDKEFQNLDSGYLGAAQPPSIPGEWKLKWAELLGPPDAFRFTSDVAGFWNPGTTGFIYGHSTFQTHTALASGVATRINQTMKLAYPMQEANLTKVYRRILAEVLVADICALEELLYLGNRNRYGPSLPPLTQVWMNAGHGGASDLSAAAAYLPSTMEVIRRDIRNKIACHVDPNIPVSEIDLSRWPVDLSQTEEEVAKFLNQLTDASRKDIRTIAFFSPPQTLKNCEELAPKREFMSWNSSPTNTGSSESVSESLIPDHDPI